ncbi:MAG: TIGR04255 family protein [Promethearchaeia archaeon]
MKEYYKFQELINENYPEYGEDLSIIGLPEALQLPETLKRISFINNQSKNRVKISVNSFVYSTSNYLKFKEFKDEIINLFEKFRMIFKIKSCQRIGLRYINIYLLNDSLENSLKEVNELFSPFYNSDFFKKEEIFKQNIEIRTKLENNFKIMYRTLFDYDRDKERYAHILDFDVYIENVSPIEKYKEKMEELHNIEKNKFLLSVTSKFMEKMEFID